MTVQQQKTITKAFGMFAAGIIAVTTIAAAAPRAAFAQSSASLLSGSAFVAPHDTLLLRASAANSAAPAGHLFWGSGASTAFSLTHTVLTDAEGSLSGQDATPAEQAFSFDGFTFDLEGVADRFTGIAPQTGAGANFTAPVASAANTAAPESIPLTTENSGLALGPESALQTATRSLYGVGSAQTVSGMNVSPASATAAVPESGTVALLAAAVLPLAGILARRRRRQQAG